MLTVEEFCKENNYDDKVSFLIQAAVSYDKNIDSFTWRDFARNTGYEQEVFDTLKEMIDNANTEVIASKNTKIPAHYEGKYEPIELIWRLKLSFCAGSIIKYLARKDKKDSELSNLKKVEYYFELLIQNKLQLSRNKEKNNG